MERENDMDFDRLHKEALAAARQYGEIFTFREHGHEHRPIAVESAFVRGFEWAVARLKFQSDVVIPRPPLEFEFEPGYDSSGRMVEVSIVQAKINPKNDRE